MTRLERFQHIAINGVGARCVLKLPDGSEHVIILRNAYYEKNDVPTNGRCIIDAMLPEGWDVVAGIVYRTDLDDDVEMPYLIVKGDPKTGKKDEAFPIDEIPIDLGGEG